MNIFYINTLKLFKKLYSVVAKVKPLQVPAREEDPEIISNMVYEKLMSDKPCMIARFGSTELMTVANHIGVNEQGRAVFPYIKGEALPWWWDKNNMIQMQRWSGFFPPTLNKIEKFSEMMLSDMKQVDILGSWLGNEYYFSDKLKNANKVWLIFLDPFWVENPWTKALKGKKVLVVHPFAELIAEQYSKRRSKIFINKNILPEFELKTVKAVQSLGGDSNGFSDWFEALEDMKDRIDKEDYDICILGCGAYGFPLAAHVKRKGKKAIHIGGSLQLLFGIIGKRWEDPNYGSRARSKCKNLNYPDLINEFWVRPENFRTKHSDNVEGGCYW
ncbi:hypothetical protein INR75_02025 [Zunongwangia sp. SCSIO 43204]|uniref:hypothetical protein n=1 Tax=Zunongwangia sp. SCSIO 43204 TaxID=2779359 RepID=UPI001CAA2AE5|nr:hypothetical protein [Zunongwangia sp. SCSIO 43204]UAB84829.1 hypothetical protein INR75_02025 [Zunongwangia sp. SCSIO 43204]